MKTMASSRIPSTNKGVQQDFCRRVFSLKHHRSALCALAVVLGLCVTQTSSMAALITTGLTLWLDGSDASTLYTDAGTTNVTTSGQAVYQWNNKAPAFLGSYNAVQGNATIQPLYTTNAKNGLSAVTFSGDIIGQTGMTWGAGFEVFAVVKNDNWQAPTGAGGYEYIVSSNGSGATAGVGIGISSVVRQADCIL